MTDRKMFTQKRVEVLTLIVTTITLVLILFMAWKVNQAVHRVEATVNKIELSVKNPAKEAVNRAEGFLEKEIKKGVNKLRGKD